MQSSVSSGFDQNRRANNHQSTTGNRNSQKIDTIQENFFGELGGHLLPHYLIESAGIYRCSAADPWTQPSLPPVVRRIQQLKLEN
jgi:hypothetical protein